MRKLLALLMIELLLFNAQAQAPAQGQWSVTGTITMTGSSQGVSNIGVSLPTSWVDNHQCDPISGVYDVVVTVKTTGGDYPGTIAGLNSALTDWKNASDRSELIQVDAGLNLHGSSYATAADGTNALLIMPIKAGATKCVTIGSSTPTTAGLMVCGHGLPGYGGFRDPGCTHDIAKMWKFTVDSTPTSGFDGIYFPHGSNHILIKDGEFSIAAGSAQSAAGVKVVILVEMNGDHIGLQNNYFHGWNPGDAGQPTGATSTTDANGVCLTWKMSGTAATVAGSTTVTWVSGKRFGMSFADATHSLGWNQSIAGTPNALHINGVDYTISGHDPAASDTVLTTLTGAVSTGTFAYDITNPMLKYNKGCGDDSRGIQVNCDTCWLAYSYIEKIHWRGSESHAISSGFSNGPTKYIHNWIEAGACGFFSGGGPIDTRGGGPVSDVEIRGNIFMRDLDWRFLSASAGGSPHPPFGCGPLDKNAAHDNCPINWGIKNNVEFKFGIRVLINGNIIDGVWADGQSGYLMLITVKQDDGGYNATTGRPNAAINNFTIANNWFRNAPQVMELTTRSLGPGNGDGISQPVTNMDYLNNVFSNVNDDGQWGTPGPDLSSWAASSNKFLCNMTRTSNIAHASCLPIQLGNLNGGYSFPVLDGAFGITSVSSVANVVTIALDNRMDPMIGRTISIVGTAGWSGTFTMTGVTKSGSSTICTTDFYGNAVAANAAVGPQPCVRADGTFGDAIIYTDLINHPGTASLCNSKSTCDALNGGAGIQTTIFSAWMRQPDLSANDNVVVHNWTGGTSCTGGYTVGITPPSVQAVAPTTPTSLEVFYPNVGPDDSLGTVQCELDNGSGLPKHVRFLNNTVLSADFLSIGSSTTLGTPSVNGVSAQHYDNSILDNTFIMHDTGTNSVLTCSAFLNKEGKTAFPCWDQPTFKLYGNVLQGRLASNWDVVNPPSGQTNFFPLTATCAGAVPDGTCAGFSGYMNGIAFPTASCVFDGVDYKNCPLMAAPWSNNFTLSKVTPFSAASVIFGHSANITAVESAFTSTIYVCATYCGPHGPYLD